MEENCDQRNMALLGQIFDMNVNVGCIVCVCATSISISPSPTSVDWELCLGSQLVVKVFEPLSVLPNMNC